MNHAETATGAQWRTFYKYDDSGRLILAAAPSAVSGHDETRPDLLDNQSGSYTHLRNSEGLIQTISYHAGNTATETTAGGVAGYLHQTSLQRGETGTAVLQSAVQYYARTANGITVHPVATETVYRNSGGSGGQTVSYAYTWQSGEVSPESVTVTLPTVTTAQNGPGTADTATTFFDGYGRPTWHKDGAGVLTYLAYDQASGAVVKAITDVNSAQTGDFTGLPTGWSTPSGAGLHLVELAEVDALGRVTKATAANGNLTYAVYKDALHEVRVYAGWDTGTNAPTGPTQVLREDRAGSYAEAFTMTATPALTGGRPDGSETVSGVQTLSRSYTNAAGQFTLADRYFNLSSLTYSTSTSLGTEGTHFSRTELAYDSRGRLHRTLSPTDTIYRTVFDALGRPVSDWVGTDDTPTSGFWSPTNTAGTDLVKVREYVYDAGLVGDSNLTRVIDIPGGGAANRQSDLSYDWRNRLVAAKSGVEGSEGSAVNRPLVYLEYDNLGQVIVTEQYDGDTVTIADANSDGVPDRPSSSLLRAKSTAEYDEQGRAFRSHVWSVNPSTGAVSSSSLKTDVWFDHRGLAIKTASPGGLVTKAQFDGAGRPVTVWTTDGGSDTGWSDADDVTGDVVLEQAEMSYDAAGNVLTVTARRRFHDETGTGALGTASSGVKARVSYIGFWYDKADRPTAQVDVGTNGGSAWTRPSSPPTRSDTELVTSYTYGAAGWMETVTDPKGIVTRQEYDAAGRTTKVIEHYTNGTVTDTSNKTVEYAYDAGDHVTSLKALLTGGGYQETKWVYGVSAADGSVLTSNDLLRHVRHPDPSTGAASSDEQESSTVNGLGQVVTATDRNGSVHTYGYDVLGRLVSDTVSTLGSNVDGGVRRIEVAYDGQGNAATLTSYDATTGGNIVNQVTREYNGLGQMTVEYQSHSGAVVPASTPKVQYAYSEMTGGANHSRLTSMTYPNGKVLTYNYSTGLNDTISRLSSLSDSSGTLESYDYLGLATVVRRAHPQPGVDLTYIKQGTESNGDAGDQYTGLDRFDRVKDQRWLKTSTGTHADRFQYGYDRDSNRTYRENLVDATFSELYAYDSLNQLSSFQRGTLNGTKDGIVGTPTRSQSWDPDALGNFDGVTTDSGTQSRSHNRQNEITSVSGATTPTYDANANLTRDETGKQFVYDAWNRLVTVKDSGGSTLVSYKYDPMNRRVSETASGTTRDLYYSQAWQVLEERIGGVARVQYVWSPVYVDALVLRDRDANSDGTLEERLWVVQDANYNITALLDNSGNVVERFIYDPFGGVTVRTAAWTPKSTSDYSWQYLHQGGRLEFASGLYEFRFRWYSPTLMRWMNQDPIAFAAGDVNLYRSVSNNPTGFLDPRGLDDLTWQNIIDAAEAAGLPTTIILKLAALNQTEFRSVQKGFRYRHRWVGKHIIELRSDFYDSLKKGGKGGPKIMGMLYNELFSAYYHQCIDDSDNQEAKWIRNLIFEAKIWYNAKMTQAHGGAPSPQEIPGLFSLYEEMTEEAMSEMIADIADWGFRPFPGRIEPQVRPGGFGSAQHSDPKEKWGGWRVKPIADAPLPQRYRDLTLWILLYGDRDPAPGEKRGGWQRRVLILERTWLEQFDPLRLQLENEAERQRWKQ